MVFKIIIAIIKDQAIELLSMAVIITITIIIITIIINNTRV